MSPIEVGSILEGRVSGITKFGAFVDLGNNQTGLIHISEVAESYVNDVNDYLKENDAPQSEQILDMEDHLYELFPTIDKNPYLEKNLNVRFAFNLIHLAPGIVTSGTQVLKDLKKLLSGNK